MEHSIRSYISRADSSEEKSALLLLALCEAVSLELCVARRAREGDDVTDVRHASDEEQETLKA